MWRLLAETYYCLPIYVVYSSDQLIVWFCYTTMWLMFACMAHFLINRRLFTCSIAIVSTYFLWHFSLTCVLSPAPNVTLFYDPKFCLIFVCFYCFYDFLDGRKWLSNQIVWCPYKTTMKFLVGKLITKLQKIFIFQNNTKTTGQGKRVKAKLKINLPLVRTRDWFWWEKDPHHLLCCKHIGT